eukprot:sb/3468268/
MRNDHPRKEFQCSECARSYDTEPGLTKHQQLHSLSRKFVCEYCGLRFEEKRLFLAHRRTNHIKNEPFRCRYHIRGSNSKGSKWGNKWCGFEALSMKEVYDHIIADHPVKRFKCKFCPLSFDYSGSRWKHETKEHVKKSEDNLPARGESPDEMPELESAILEHDEMPDPEPNSPNSDPSSPKSSGSQGYPETDVQLDSISTASISSTDPPESGEARSFEKLVMNNGSNTQASSPKSSGSQGYHETDTQLDSNSTVSTSPTDTSKPGW